MEHLKTTITVTVSSADPTALTDAMGKFGSEFPVAQIQVRMDLETTEETEWVREKLGQVINDLPSDIEVNTTTSTKEKRDPMLAPRPMDTLWSEKVA